MAQITGQAARQLSLLSSLTHPLHGELHEVSAGLRALLAPKFDVDVPEGSVQQNLAMGSWLCVVDVGHVVVGRPRCGRVCACLPCAWCLAAEAESLPRLYVYIGILESYPVQLRRIFFACSTP